MAVMSVSLVHPRNATLPVMSVSSWPHSGIFPIYACVTEKKKEGEKGNGENELMSDRQTSTQTV